MSSVPYLYVNLTAMVCYTVMFVAFIAAKKNTEIRSFIVVLVGFMLWTGGSILMRLQAWPGVEFWFYVSILALFSLALLLYNFVCAFARVKGYFLKIVWTAGTVIILALTATGFFIQPPEVTVLAGGGVVFSYTMKDVIAIPFAFFICVVISIILIFQKLIKTKGIRTPGLLSIIGGCLAVVVGNLLQILPGNIFPWDTLSGIFFAAFLMYSLYKKRMFRLTLLISRRVLLVISAVVCLIAIINFVNPLEKFLEELLRYPEDVITAIVIVFFTGLIAVVYVMLRLLIDALFTREEQQGRILKHFSSAVTQSLNTGEIMDLLVSTIQGEIPVEHVYVCIHEDGRYVSRHSSSPLAASCFYIRDDSPCIDYIKDGEICFILKEFQGSPAYLSMWEEEKSLFGRLRLECIVALKDAEEIVGLVLLSNKERHSPYSYGELSFLSTVGSIASIAVKNASLYERVYREARIDALTGVFNYKYFVEKLREEHKKAGNHCLALMYLDLDDFKLYNQLYGTHEGDRALALVGEILSRCAGQAGLVFRYSGKTFAVLLPGFDGRLAENLAREMQRQISRINAVPERKMYKELSISGGICVSPQSASSPKEMMENADLAVYQAKALGKHRIVVFKGGGQIPQRIAQRAMEIIEAGGENPYGEASQTIMALTAAIDAKDHYTGKHSLNVARYASVLATAAGLNDEQVRMIYAAALLHDIGKISVPEKILCKKGNLTNDEYVIMTEHVNGSINMMRHLPSMDYLIPASVGHHERWDGTGYPLGISGEEIPISARCLALADAFDAMTTDRPYRKAMSIEYAAAEVEKNAGTQFDPRLAKLFVELIRSQEITLSK